MRTHYCYAHHHTPHTTTNNTRAGERVVEHCPLGILFEVQYKAKRGTQLSVQFQIAHSFEKVLRYACICLHAKKDKRKTIYQ